MTFFDLLRSSLRLIGAIQPGRAPYGAEIVDGQFVANSMLDAWTAERLGCYAIRYDLLTLIANQQAYTIGIDPAGSLTANFNVPRPVKITDANLLVTSTVRRPIGIADHDQWAAIRYQAVTGPPRRLYLDNNFANGFATIRFYPIPDAAYQWEQYSWQALTQFTGPTDLVEFPPGYADAIRYNLAVRLAPEWGKVASPDVIELARSTKAAIASLNAESPLLLGGDSDGLNNSYGGYYEWRDADSENQ